ncbi:MAG: hypothetical protein J5902_03880 [Paludibacteraceae bacterium]|nr:hypothetical protein [Paludibacteraceae bacterium]
MAKANFYGLQNVRGTISKKTVKLPSGEIVTRRMVARLDANGQQRIYFQDQRERSTPVTDKEKAQRTRFADAAAFFAALTPDERIMWGDVFRRNLYKFRDKKYATLRGYIVARHMANDVNI